ncbi:DUF397 domain-containing protein [Streptomyces sp. YIM 98790]|uniref:DUF397 domain-containing protein n=1 Tax=Streptomyces sp. YIM 98790 TaxID=2689077 RepID=UPI00140B2D1D|nr:DUF397 domain-containing protein [Streptomyces sp. YIM 98790]
MEAAPAPTIRGWRTSSHSGDTGDGCVEFAVPLTWRVAVRDAKRDDLPHSSASSPAGPALITAAKEGTFR